jgi:hypothetical protein
MEVPLHFYLWSLRNVNIAIMILSWGGFQMASHFIFDNMKIIQSISKKQVRVINWQLDYISDEV